MPLHVGQVVTPYPTGTTKVKGNITTALAYAVVTGCVHLVEKGKTFNLTKIALSCDQDAVAKVSWGDPTNPSAAADQTIEYKITGKIPMTDWFAENEVEVKGDGTKQIFIQAKYPSGGSAGDLYAELCGNEA